MKVKANGDMTTSLHKKNRYINFQLKQLNIMIMLAKISVNYIASKKEILDVFIFLVYID